MGSSASDEGKLFVGGLAWDTKDATLRDYFNQYAEVTRAVIVRDKATGQPRGFGFVVFSDPAVIDSVLPEKHTIDGRPVEVRRATSREKQQSSGSRDSNANGSKNLVRQRNFRTKKIFVGGLPSALTKVEFTQYFQNFGDITDAVIMFDQATGRSRGFGFITFDTEDAVDRVLNKNFYELSNKLVEVKRALPKEVSPGCFGARCRTSNAYSSYSATTNAFDTQMESRGFLQLQPAIGGYPSYSAFGALGYGYSIATNGAIYSGLGAYPFGSYENATASHNGSAVALGEQTGTSTGYFSSAGFLKTPWGSQAQDYGTLAYGLNANYGVPIPWSTPVINAPLAQSPRHTPGAGNCSSRGREGSYTDSGRSRTVNRNKWSSTKSNAGHNANELRHHRPGGEGTKGRLYNSSNGS